MYMCMCVCVPPYTLKYLSGLPSIFLYLKPFSGAITKILEAGKFGKKRGLVWTDGSGSQWVSWEKSWRPASFVQPSPAAALVLRERYTELRPNPMLSLAPVHSPTLHRSTPDTQANPKSAKQGIVDLLQERKEVMRDIYQKGGKRPWAVNCAGWQ